MAATFATTDALGSMLGSKGQSPSSNPMLYAHQPLMPSSDATLPAAQLSKPVTLSQRREYLVWSPRVLYRSVLHFTWMALALMVLNFSPYGSTALVNVREHAVAALSSTHRLPVWASLSLLSSSCCLVQLLLNLLQVGCAGFNIILGPARSFFLAATIHLHYFAYRAKLTEPIVLLLSAIVTFSPELVALFGASGLLWRSRKKRLDGEVINLSLPTMGCIACVDAVSRALRAVPEVRNVDVRLNDESKGGHAAVVVTAADDALMSRLRDACTAAGFAPTP